jgi:hypothetical protein
MGDFHTQLIYLQINLKEQAFIPDDLINPYNDQKRSGDRTNMAIASWQTGANDW